MIVIQSTRNNPLPVSVLINLKESRKWFFYGYCLPMVKVNNPAEIIINDDTEPGAARKWNAAFKASTQPYVMIVSDDFIIPTGHINRMFKTMQECELSGAKQVGYVYPSGYYCIPFMPEFHNVGKNFMFKSQTFNPDKLKQGNYIDGSCLWKREHFVQFDEKLPRLLDWDVALNNLINNGIVGKIAENTEFITFCLDSGISSKENDATEAQQMIKEKYKL